MEKTSKSTCHIIIFIFITCIQVNAYFFNIDSFLQPVLQPELRTFGSAIVHNNDRKQDQVIPFDSRSVEKNMRQKVLQMEKISKQNLRRRDEDHARDIYSIVGIPENIIFTKIIPVHTVAKHDLNRYFSKGSTSKQRLYTSLKRLKDLIDWVAQTYLKNITNVIIGDSNTIIGKNVYVKANHHKIKGMSNFVFNPHFKDKVIKGDNIVRISRFDINLQKIDWVRVNPYQCITILEQ